MVGGQKCGVWRDQSGVKVIFCYGWMNKNRICFTALEEGFQRYLRLSFCPGGKCQIRRGTVTPEPSLDKNLAVSVC